MLTLANPPSLYDWGRFLVWRRKRVRPELIPSLFPFLGKPTVCAARRKGVVILHDGGLSFPSRLHPAESFNYTEIDKKRVIPRVRNLAGYLLKLPPVDFVYLLFGNIGAFDPLYY